MRAHRKAYKTYEKTLIPPRLNEKFIEDVCQLMRAGNFFSDAVRALGVHVSTGCYWRNKGREKEFEGTLFQKLADDTDQANAQFICGAVTDLRIHGKKEWGAVVRMLESHSPNWKKQDKLEVTHAVETIDVSKLSDDELEAYAELCEKARRA